MYLPFFLLGYCMTSFCNFASCIVAVHCSTRGLIALRTNDVTFTPKYQAISQIFYHLRDHHIINEPNSTRSTVGTRKLTSNFDMCVPVCEIWRVRLLFLALVQSAFSWYSLTKNCALMVPCEAHNFVGMSEREKASAPQNLTLSPILLSFSSETFTYLLIKLSRESFMKCRCCFGMWYPVTALNQICMH